MALTLRVWHSRISALAAPTILFFALSGSLQIFDLHESHGGYKASPALSAMGRLHKDQVLAPAPEHQGPPAMAGSASAPAGPPRAADSPRRLLSTLLLKIFFCFCALALAVTTLFGIWIGATHPRRAREFWTLLAAGALIPIVLVLIGAGS